MRNVKGDKVSPVDERVRDQRVPGDRSQVLGVMDAFIVADTGLLQLSDFILRSTSIWLLP